MVRNYKRTTTRQAWSENAMTSAVKAYVTGIMGSKKASKTFGVPQTTLERRVAKFRANPDSAARKGGMGNFKSVFTPEQEQELVCHIKHMEERLFGLTSSDIRHLAYQLAAANKIKNTFNKRLGMAGEGWLCGFLKRHPDLSYRKPEPTSAARAMGFNRVAVQTFFSLLERIIDENKLTGDKIYNVDETGVSTVPKSHSKIIATKGKRQVGTLTSAERGKMMATVLYSSASGYYMPPMMISLGNE